MAKKRSGRRNEDPTAIPQLDLFADTPKFYAPSVADHDSVLREWRERYRALENELDTLSKKAEEHQFLAIPDFQAWVARTFGEELSAIRELEEEIRKNEVYVLATLAEATSADCPESEAYRVVLLREERGEDLFPKSEEPHEEAEDDWSDGWESVDPEVDYRRADENPSSRRTPDERSREYFAEKKKSAAREERSDGLARLKTVYRKLAFALHPDANPNLSARERKIWDEVQRAYSSRDLARLESLAAWIETGSKGWLDRMNHAGTLRAMVLEKIAAVRATHVRINRLRKEDSWRYWQARGSESAIAELRTEIEEGVLRDFLFLRRRLREFELQFQRWLSGEPRTRRNRSSSRRRSR
jgi:hypothetical protein